MFIRSILGVFFVVACFSGSVLGMGPHEDARFLQQLADELARNAQHAARAREVRIQDRKAEEDGYVQEIRDLKAHGVANDDPRIEQATRRIKNLEKQETNDEKNEDLGRNIIGGVFNAVLGDHNKEREIEKAQQIALAEGHMKNKGAKEQLKMVLDQFNDVNTLVKWAAFLAGATLGIAGVYYLVRLCYQYAEAQMGKPSLIRESSINGMRQELKKFIASLLKSEQEIEESLSDIILSPEIQEKVYLLAEDTRQTKEFGLPYQNVLFYGPPGTGKTEFAKILSRYSGMDYAILSGADFSQFKNGEGIVELHKLFDWAEKSKKGLIIFIDEADACFRDRAMLDKDGVNLVNAFLSHTGSSSDKFMIILATNYENELDAAVRSRIHKKVPFLLPELEERFKIFKLKVNKYISADKRSYNKDGVWVEEHLDIESAVDDEFWMNIANKTTGFSGRDIDQAVGEMRLRAYRSGQNVLTKSIVETVVNDKIVQLKKDRDATAYQKQKFEHVFKINKNSEVACEA